MRSFDLPMAAIYKIGLQISFHAVIHWLLHWHPKELAILRRYMPKRVSEVQFTFCTRIRQTENERLFFLGYWLIDDYEVEIEEAWHKEEKEDLTGKVE